MVYPPKEDSAEQDSDLFVHIAPYPLQRQKRNRPRNHHILPHIWLYMVHMCLKVGLCYT